MLTQRSEIVQNITTIKNLLSIAPIIPVIVLDEVEKAQPLAKALISGGLRVIEVTLRTKNALKIIEQMAKIDGAIIASGTVRNFSQMQNSYNAGCQFMVAPGTTKKLLNEAENIPIPLLPGVASVSEAMMAAERGYQYLKLFPAEPIGGVKLLKSLISPLPELKFCPTGGINKDNLKSYFELANVISVGGSWIATKQLLENNNFMQIEKNAKNALNIIGALSKD